MHAALYLGDEVSGAGWRLAGVAVVCPPPGDETAALQQALAQRPALLLLAAPVAAAVAPALLQGAACALAPLLLVLPGRDGSSPPDLAGRLRVQLGLLP